MKKIFLFALAAVLLLAGCGKETSPADTPTTETTLSLETTPTEPPVSGVFFIQEQVFYNNDKEVARLSVTLNDAGMPETIFFDSGSDITYKPTYDDQGNIISFERIWTVYGEDTVNYAEINEHGDITKQISNKGTDEESVYETSYTYDEQGRITKTESVRNGQADHTVIIEYDEKGNSIYHEEIFHLNTAKNYTAKITNTYDNGLLVKKESNVDDGAEINITVYTYDESGRLIEESFNDNFITEYTYNENGLLIKKSVAGITTRYTYDENGRIAEVFDNGNRIVYTWVECSQSLTEAHLKLFKDFQILE